MPPKPGSADPRGASPPWITASGAEASTSHRSIQADALDRIVDRLERAAAELRSGDLAPERAAALVDECARLALEAGAELDREVRAAETGPSGQLALDQ